MKKCILCAFFKNMWKDIVKSFHVEKPSDPDWWIPLVISLIIYFIIGATGYLFVYYTKLMETIFIYGCYGLGILILIVMGCLGIFGWIKYLKELYKKSKEECE